jgi:hypothetical protein
MANATKKKAAKKKVEKGTSAAAQGATSWPTSGNAGRTLCVTLTNTLFATAAMFRKAEKMRREDADNPMIGMYGAIINEWRRALAHLAKCKGINLSIETDRGRSITLSAPDLADDLREGKTTTRYKLAK